jgi:hypothetical protein
MSGALWIARYNSCHHDYGIASMPNPIAHPAASIPFARAGLVFSALVFGSLSPDFGYFVPLPGEFFFYTVPGLILFDVPVGLLLLWLFHSLLKWPLLAALPVSWQRRLVKPAQGFSFGPPKHFAIILLSVLVGSLTHVVWDSFTHVYGWTVEQFGFLRILVGGVPVYVVLQHLSTIVGVGLLIYWFIKWLPTAPQSDRLLPRFSGRGRAVFRGICAISLAAVEGAIIFRAVAAGSPTVGSLFLVGAVIVSAGMIICLFIGVYCLAWTAAFHKSISDSA